LLTGLENKWVAALMKSDTATLDSILSDTYVDTDEHGQRTDKLGVLLVLKSGDLKFESIKLSDMQVHRYGDAAVITGSAVQAGNFKGQPLTKKIVFTDTFIRQNGKWKAVASHRSAAS
jgi:ketosteroid isomerase-like protein